LLVAGEARLGALSTWAMEEVIHEVAQHPFQIAAVSAVFWLALGLIIDQILAVIDHPALKDDPNGWELNVSQ